MEKVMNVLEQIWAIGFVRFIVYLALAFIVASLAKFLTTKLLKLVKLDKKLDKWGVNEGQVGTSLLFVGKLVYIIVFLLFLPAALEALGVVTVSEPITGLVTTFISYLPRIIAAIILIYVGIFVAKIIGQIISVLLKKTKIDNLMKNGNGEASKVLLSDIIVRIVMTVIILITFVQAFSVLQISAISDPAMTIVDAIFGAIPSILFAAIVIACGVLIAKIACGLLGNVLLVVNFDGKVAKILPRLKYSATKIVVNVVQYLIIFFVVAQGIEVLNLGILTTVAAAIIAYLPMVIKAMVIAFVAYLGASLLEGFVLKTSPNAVSVMRIAKIGIYGLAGVMIFSQLGIADTIVNAAFIIVLAAVAVAFALAFGLGGKDFAKKTLNKVDEKMEQCKAEDNAKAEEAEKQLSNDDE